MPDPLPKYRFLPWARRGLAAAIPQAQADVGGALPARAPLPVGITVSGVTPANVNLELYGPGDVIGIDQRLIVRTEPRANLTDFESNYLAAIEFDLPDFPWMFTPARAGANERLRPWCVLVVFDLRVVAPPVVHRGAPLPVITVPADVSAKELPDLTESWAWAHAQVMSDSTQVSALQQEMADQPNLNVSRLICPRRLEPSQRYVACLVPAFDLGVQRGLGQTPNGTTAKPAWEGVNPGEATLPLYFHWQFATGPAGDFESLARRLTPVKAPAKTGFQRMFVGAPGGGLPATPADDEVSYLQMEGALRAPKMSNSSLNDVIPPMRASLRDAINAAADVANGTSAASITLSPPVYGEWHLNRHTVRDGAGEPEWLRELNLDPRARAAAGLGAEVVRANQEDFMQAAWEQVGDVIKANELLNRARFSTDVHRRTYARHFLAQPQDRLFQLAAPLHARTPLAEGTVRARVTAASLPNSSVDPALRRLSSPQRSWLKQAARRGGFATAGSRSSLVASLATATDKVMPDPAQFTPDGVLGAAVLDDVRTAPGATTVDLHVFGINAQVEVAAVNRMQTARTALIKIKPQNTPLMTVRPDLGTIGVIVKRHTFKLRALQDASSGAATINVPATLTRLFAAAQKDKDAVAFLVSAEGSARAPLPALHGDKNGNLVLHRRAGDAGVVVGTLSERPRGTARAKREAWAMALDGVPMGALPQRPARREPVPVIDLATGAVRRPPIGEPPDVEPPIVRPDRPPLLTIPLPPPTKDTFAVTRFKQAFAQMSQATRLETPDPWPAFVAFDVKSARDTLVTRLNPDVMVQRRVRMMIGGVANAALEGVVGLTILPFFDRIMAAPEIAAPMFGYLAAYDRERFLPGIGQLAPDSITLLETNPRFIESFMVGLNYEMNRELLWREYPTDQRGTPIRSFWAWADGSSDLPRPIHQWNAGNLGTHVRGAGQGGQVVLLLRGQLLRRYPNTVVYVWRAQGGLLKDPPSADDIRMPVFSGAFEPDVSFTGFDLRDTDLTQGDGWFFVLQEQPTEPRFGFDEMLTVPTNELNDWSSASWPNTGVEPGGHMLVSGSPLNGKVIGGVAFGKNSAHMAHSTLQKPMRVAIHGKHLA